MSSFEELSDGWYVLFLKSVLRFHGLYKDEGLIIVRNYNKPKTDELERSS